MRSPYRPTNQVKVEFTEELLNGNEKRERKATYWADVQDLTSLKQATQHAVPSDVE